MGGLFARVDRREAPEDGGLAYIQFLGYPWREDFCSKIDELSLYSVIRCDIEETEDTGSLVLVGVVVSE